MNENISHRRIKGFALSIEVKSFLMYRFHIRKIISNIQSIAPAEISHFQKSALQAGRRPMYKVAYKLLYK